MMPALISLRHHRGRFVSFPQAYGGFNMQLWVNILLGTWLIASGLVLLGGIRFPGSGTVLAVLGIVTGILLFLVDRGGKLLPRMANILLGAWLVAAGLIPLLQIRFTGSGIILSVLSVAAGVFVLVRRV
jgi:hypothetical protein